MVRAVKVELEAETGRYIAPVESAKVKTEEFDRKVTALDRDINKLPADSAKAAFALKALGDEGTKAGVKLDDLGKKSTSIGVIDERIGHLRNEVRLLADEFNKTGNVSFLERMFGAQRELRGLENLKSDVTNALGDGARKAIPLVENALADAGQGASKGFWGVFSSLPPQAQAAIVAALVAAIAAGSVFIGATIGGALLAGVAGAGIGAAVAAQLHDPLVAGALGSLKTDLGATFKDATEAFGPVLVRSAAAFGAIVRELAPGLKSAFATAAPFAEVFLRGVGEFVRNALPGLETALVAGSKILGRLGESALPKLGSAVSEFFDDVSKGGREGGDALDFLIGMLSGTIRTLGVGIGIAEAWYGKFEDIAGLVGGLASGNFALFTDRVLALGDSSDTTASSIKSVGGAAHFAEEATRAMSDAFDKAFGSQMSVDQAATRFTSDLYGLKGALDSHTSSIDLSSAAGTRNREVIQGAIQDAKAHRDALIAAAGGANASKAAIDAANATYATDIERLKGMYVAANGSARAFDDLAGTYNVNIVTTYTQVGSPDFHQHSRDEHMRFGGITQHAQEGLLSAKVYSPMGPARYAFAEPATGGEGFVPRFGDYRRSTGIIDTEARWYGGRFVPGGGGGGGSTNISLVVHAGMGTDGYAVGRQIAEHLRPYINGKGGNVQAALGR